VASKPAIEVFGGRELRRTLNRVGDDITKDALKRANKEAAELVAAEARRLVPVESGRLKASIRATGGVASGSVKAGNKVRVPYAGVIHYGWPARNIRATPFITAAVANKIGDARRAYLRAIDRIINNANI